VLGAALHVPQDTGAVSAFALGVDPQLQGDYELIGGRGPDEYGDVVASEAFLRATGMRAGDAFEASAGYDPQLRQFSGSERLAITGQGNADRVSLFMVGVDPDASADSVAAVIDNVVPRVSAISTARAVELAEQRLSYFRQLAFILGAVSLIVGFLLVATLVSVS